MLARRLVRLFHEREMSRPLHILMLSPGFPKDRKDHLCMPYLQLFLERMQRDFPEITVSVLSIQYPYSACSYQWKGIEVTACGGDNRSFPKRFLTWRAALKSMDAINRKNPVNVVHSLWLNECAYLAQRWLKGKTVSHICTTMGQDVLAGNRYLKRLDLSGLHTVSVSERQAADLYATAGRRSDSIISWGMDEVESNNSEPTVDVLGVGSLTKLKNYHAFIETLVKVKEHRPEIRAVLIGYGPELEGLEQRAATLGLTETIEFAGELPRPEVLKRMARSKVLLHPSGYESQGFVFSEALASGMKIVSRNVGVAKEMADWKIANEPTEMAASILELLPTNGRSTRVLYPLDRTVREYTELYLDLTAISEM